jgi:hypothetical protein
MKIRKERGGPLEPASFFAPVLFYWLMGTSLATEAVSIMPGSIFA